MKELKLNDFEALVGDAFAVEGNDVELKLSEAKAMGQSVRDGGAFSLVFEGPEGTHFEQGMLRLSKAENVFDLFLVPIGPFGEGMGFEAVFT